VSLPVTQPSTRPSATLEIVVELELLLPCEDRGSVSSCASLLPADRSWAEHAIREDQKACTASPWSLLLFVDEEELLLLFAVDGFDSSGSPAVVTSSWMRSS
jgi:hypothetical protein